ncbi:MAG: 3,4-dehydroadipyl-CoA semialdehyde dehydrogenase [Aquisalimonadaceae bacterium]
MTRLKHYLNGTWVDGDGEGSSLHDPVSGEQLARVSGDGLDLRAALAYGRSRGGAALRAMSYGERAAMLRAVADVLVANRDRYHEISVRNSGSTAVDVAFDVDGGIGVLKYYASIGKAMGEARYLMEPEVDRLGRDEAFQTAHLWTPVQGIAVHINAFNFPAWGLWGKVAVALLSGVPVFAKPATATAWVAYEMVKDVVDAGVLPDGALSLLCSGGRDLMDLVGAQDVVAFTGSAATAETLRANPNVIAANLRFNVEADSLNAALLGPDVQPGSAEFDGFIKEVAREISVKAGQKCTAIRRVLVPAACIDAVEEALKARLAKLAVGDPRNEAVRMGPLVSKAQQQAAWAGLERLRAEARVVFGGEADFPLLDADHNAGCFFPPTLLRSDDPDTGRAVHEVEVFGPVATLIPYRDGDHAVALAARGGGSLVASVFTGDDAFATAAALGIGAFHGRVAIVNEPVIKSNPGHGVVMPQCIHGGPGRAGGGEELGGQRALRFYHQRTAVQASLERLQAMQAGAAIFSA